MALRCRRVGAVHSIKRRNTRAEPMFSALPPTTDMAWVPFAKLADVIAADHHRLVGKPPSPLVNTMIQRNMTDAEFFQQIISVPALQKAGSGQQTGNDQVQPSAKTNIAPIISFLLVARYNSIT
jgi:hypothetical protein